MPTSPVLKSIPFISDIPAAYRALRGAGPSVMLESARFSKKMGRYSIVATEPFSIFRRNPGVADPDPFEALRRKLARHARSGEDGVFTGGAIGFVSYEARRFIEPRLRASPRIQDPVSGLPELYFLFFDEGLVCDHERRVCTVFAPTKARTERLAAKLKQLPRRKDVGRRQHEPFPEVELSQSRAQFERAVEAAKRWIRRGDIFQANLSQRLSFKAPADALAAYERLKAVNPSPFFGFLDAGDFQILSGSPERLVKMEGGRIQTRPIAGTRSRGRDALADRAATLDLLLSEKERAEHIMLVDLERNDMGRVAEYGSVAVDELMTVEDYSHVKHIVSNVRGALKEGCDGVDVLRAFFPGGTITGAPKVRCMEIIDALEPVARGPYTGSLGYFSFTGNMDFNIIIRSLVISQGRAHLQVGAGIVADSDPGKEYDETLYKAEGVLTALFGKTSTRAFLGRLGVAGRSDRRGIAV